MAGSGTNLVDRIGGVTGVFGGSPAPQWNNANYLSFQGGHGAVGGNYNRVDFGLPVSMCKSYSDSFSVVLGFKSSKSDANGNTLFDIGDMNTYTSYLQFSINATHKAYFAGQIGTAYELFASAANFNDDKWHLIIISYTTNSFVCYCDGISQTKTKNRSNKRC